MALIDYEGWDKETNGFLSNWFNLLGDCYPQADGFAPFGYGRCATGYLFGRVLPTPVNDIWCQFHFYLPAGAAPYGGSNFLRLQNTASNDHCTYSVDFATRTIYMNYQSGGFAACTAGAFAYDAWNFIQLRTHIGNHDGSMEVWLNGTRVGLVQNVDTESTGGPTVHQWRLESGNQIRFDNLLIYTETGNAPNARTPETRIYTVQPNAAGASTDFTPTGAATNWETQQEQPNDGDTTYASAAAAPATDLFATATSPMAAGAIVYAVGVEIVARKDDAGANEIDEVVRSGGANYAAGSPTALTSTYQRFRNFWDRDPATATAWTVAAANSAQVGYRRTT